MTTHRKPDMRSVDIAKESWELIRDMRNENFPTMADVIYNLMVTHQHYALYHEQSHYEDAQGNVVIPLNEDGEEA